MRLRALAVCTLLCLFHARVDARPTLQWTAPATVVGDGVTPQLLVLAAPGSRPPPPAALTLEAGGGTLAPPASSAGHLEVSWLPPRVASTVTLELHAAAPGFTAAQVTVKVEPPPVGAGQVSSGGALDLRVPERLTLRAGATASISYRPRDARPLTLNASAGQLGPTGSEPGGRLAATYSPPDSAFPRVVFVWAQAPDGEVVDWAPMLLQGLAQVSTRARRGAMIENRVGETRFGPLRVGADAKVVMLVEVPPGLGVGSTRVVESDGTESMTPLDLAPPPLERVAALCPSSADRLLLLVVDERGRRVDAATLELSASAGQLGPVARIGHGTFESRWAAPAELARGAPVTLSALLAGESSPATCTALHAGPAPTELVLTLPPGRHRPGDAAVAVQVRLGWPGGASGRAPPIELTADFGQLAPTQATGHGEVATTWTLPPVLGGRRRAMVTARAGGLAARAELVLEPGDPARMVLHTSRPRLVADGAASLEVVVEVFDEHGNPVHSATPSATAAGSLTAFRASADGQLRARYTAPRARPRGGVDIIEVRAGAALGSLTLWLEPAAPRYRAQVRLGWLSNFGKVSGPLVMAGAAIRVGHSWLGVDAGAYQSSVTRLDATGLESVGVEVRGVPLLARADLRTALGRLQVEAGVQAGVIFGRTVISAASVGRLVEPGTYPGAGVHLGLGQPLGPGSLVADAAYWYVPLDSASVSGNLGGLAVGAGYSVGF